MIKAKEHIYEITPYVGGESKAKDGQRIIKLSSNEGAYGPSPKAIMAMQNVAKNMHRYPDGSCYELREALAKKHKISMDDIVCGAGSDEIISLLCQAYLGEGDEILYSQHGFLMYAISAQVNGAKAVSADEVNLKTNIDNLISNVTDKTKILFLANPNNPTGSYLKRDEIIKIHKALPNNVLLVLDAAYAEYVDDPDYSAGHDLVSDEDNIVVTRTFSKAYGMGGVRLGWMHGPAHVVDILNRVRGPFNVSIEAQAAGIAALEDDGFLQSAIEKNKKVRAFTAQALEDIGIKSYPSAGNFLLVDFDTAKKAEDVRLALKEEGVLVRQVGAYGLPSCLRVTIGTQEEMALVVEGISRYINKNG